ncbi:MAG: FliM/FliN family flagellar motor switch protein [Pseudomonadota bacterium]
MAEDSELPETSADEAAVDAESAEAESGEALLSDDEKDALLAGVADGAVVGGEGMDARTITPFVLRPDAYINYGSYPVLQQVCGKVAKRLAQRWSKLVQGSVSISSQDLYTATYTQAVERLRAPILSFRMNLSPLPGHSVVVVDNPLLAALVEGFFGFSADESAESTEETPAPALQIREQFTRGEYRVAELALSELCEVQNEAWEKVHPIQASVAGSETDPTVGMGLEPKDAVVVARFTVEAPGGAGSLFWFLPASQIAPIADDLEGATNARPVQPDPAWYPLWRAHLLDIDVDATATVGTMTLSLRKVVALSPGDLIPLSGPDRARLSVGRTQCAQGAFGRLEAVNAFQLSAWCKTT